MYVHCTIVHMYEHFNMYAHIINCPELIDMILYVCISIYHIFFCIYPTPMPEIVNLFFCFNHQEAGKEEAKVPRLEAKVPVRPAGGGT